MSRWRYMLLPVVLFSCLVYVYYTALTVDRDFTHHQSFLSMNLSQRLQSVRNSLMKKSMSLRDSGESGYSLGLLSSTPMPMYVTTTFADGTVQPYEILENLTDSYKLLYKYRKSMKELARKPLCPLMPPGLVGEIKVLEEYYPIKQLNSLDFRVKAGGSYKPPTCQPNQRLALVIPFRKREIHLSILLLNLHPLLQSQQLDYTIFVVNQVQGSKFNRAMLMNIGFLEAMKRGRYSCVIFHDVDLLPQNDNNIYRCPKGSVRHMSVYIDKFKYRLPYNNMLGGIVAISSHLFVKVNGYSNQFFGWGGEDDDFSLRCQRKNLDISRYPKHIATYAMIRHELDTGNEANEERFNLLKYSAKRQEMDGLNSLQGAYMVKYITSLPLYTRISVHLDQNTVMNSEPHPLPPYLTHL